MRFDPLIASPDPSDSNTWHLTTQDGCHVATVNCLVGERFARLFAAAPELLEKTLQLASYAATVRTDRRDPTREFALQTGDWCEGLLDRAKAAMLEAANVTNA